ncbi:sel1 repeat family protein [Devosia sp. A8/3-2]|nr:sel1 repeat family protein [Devosia sp. A8/3-2]
MMRTIRDTSLISVATALTLALAMSITPAHAQTAADAALDMANMLDGAGGGVSGDDLLAALENAAEAGQPMAMWQLGTMYENGEGVAKDPAKAFGYFAQIANEHADAALRGVESDIVAQSFVKVGDYYKEGLPDAGIPADAERSHALLLHAATYFGDADAQYRVGLLYLNADELGVNPLQSARWFSLAARKGCCPARAQLGRLLFNGVDGIEAQPIEGLMWLNSAQQRCTGTADAARINDLINRGQFHRHPRTAGQKPPNSPPASPPIRRLLIARCLRLKAERPTQHVPTHSVIPAKAESLFSDSETPFLGWYEIRFSRIDPAMPWRPQRPNDLA